MIVSHKMRCVFVAVPKTATHAIRFGLRKHLADGDVEQVGRFVKKRSDYPGICEKRHGHITAVELREALGADQWNGYFKFAFVRNPWDRFVSSFFYYYRNTQPFMDRPRRFMQLVLERHEDRARLLMQPQSSFLCDSKGRCLVDFVGRYEQLQEDFERISVQLGIPHEPLDRVNRSVHCPYSHYFDERLKNNVAKWYAEDIRAFGYSFEEADGVQPASA